MAEQAFKKRGKRCEIHGILYDPELTSGCARCRKRGFRNASAPKFLSLLITLLALTVVGAYVINGALSTLKAEDPLATTEVDSFEVDDATGDRASIMDASPFEANVRAIESALFDPAETDFAIIADRVASEAATLASAMRRAETSSDVTTIIGDFAVEARDTVTSIDSLQHVRDRWIRLREAVFRPAPWMASGVASAGIGRLAVQAHLDIVQALVSTALSASDSTASGDESGDDVADGLATEVAALQATLPATPPLDADPRLLAGRRAIEGLLSELETLAARPADPERGARLEDVATRASETQFELENLLGS